MPCDSSIEIIFAIGRVSVLILGLFSGTFCIYLGWRLYRDNVRSTTSGELQYNSMRFVARALGPGVFLALFGATIVWTIVSQKVDLSTAAPVSKTSSTTKLFANENASRNRIVAVADVAQVKRPPHANTASPCDQCLVIKKTRVYQSGEAALTVEQYEQALEAATVSLSMSLNTAEPDSDRVGTRTHIRALQELSFGLAK